MMVSFPARTTLHTEQTDGPSLAIPRRETERYLGYRKITPTPEVSARIDVCEQQLRAKSTPKAAWQAFPLDLSEEGHLRAAGLDIPSEKLFRNCRGCCALVMMAATIGPGVDFLIRRAGTTSMTDAAIYQAAGAAMVEEWCDRLNLKIKNYMQERYGLAARPRFSPGYGDLPLELQRDFFRILNLPHTCGMSLGDTLLMSPSKSVTAFIGLAETEDSYIPAGCEICGKDNCDFRR